MGTRVNCLLAQKIVNRSGGCIKVNAQEGRGTAFHLYLPQSSKPTAPALTDKNLPPVRTARTNSYGGRQNSRSQHDAATTARQGNRAIDRANSLEAVNTARADPNHSDLVITNHTVPGLRGATLAAKLGTIPHLPDSLASAKEPLHTECLLEVVPANRVGAFLNRCNALR
jgi:hypothetical protein